MPSTDQLFRISWASFSMGDMSSDIASDNSIFVGDLASDVNDAALLETFSCRYSSVKGAKVVIDANTGRSKGYGFVLYHTSGLVSIHNLFGREIRSEFNSHFAVSMYKTVFALHSFLAAFMHYLFGKWVCIGDK